MTSRSFAHYSLSGAIYGWLPDPLNTGDLNP